MLAVEDIHSFYGKSHILHGVSLELRPSEIVCLLGRNGAGKSTTLKSIVGAVVPNSGHVHFDGRDWRGRRLHEIVQAGISMVPENRGIFQLLTVEENIDISVLKSGTWDKDAVFQIFPRLKERRRNRGGNLSGGEQQMLAIGRALVSNPKVLLLDEPTEGLAPVIVDELMDVISGLRKHDLAILLVEQSIEVCTELGDRHYVLEHGHIVYHGSRDEFAHAENVRQKYLTLESV